MNDFNDLFAGVDFPDVKIAADGSTAVIKGQKSDSPPDKGQLSDSPTDPGTDPDKTVNVDPNASDQDKDKGKQVDDKKPLPYDQDPKWIKARAAEKVLQSIMDEHGYLDAEELAEALNSGKSLKEALADQDLDSLKRDSAAYKEYKKRMEEAQKDDPDNGNNQEPDEKYKKLLTDHQKLSAELEEIKETSRISEEDAESYSRYTSDVDKVMEILSDQVPLSDVEQTLFKQVMGIDNPSTEVSMDDRKGVRNMVKGAVTQFKATLEAIKQQTIDDYAAGKTKMMVTDPTKSADSDSPILNQKNYDAEKQSVDEVFSSGKTEMLEILEKGMKAAY
jgi:hypothetical protein